MVEQCGGTVELCWWNSGTVEKCWWHSVVQQWNSGTVIVEQGGGSVEQCWWNSGTVMVEQCR